MGFSRIPIRWRLTLAFSLALALVILGFGLLLRQSLAASLDEGLTESLRARADEVAALVQTTGGEGLSDFPQSRLSESAESFAQVLDADGAVVSTSSAGLRGPVLTPVQAERARSRAEFTTIPQREGLDHRARLLARGVGADLVVVVGASLEDRDDTLSRLTGFLVVGGPVVLLVVSMLGYLLASSALRPVRAIQERAAEISGSPSGARLPLPAARDDIYRLGETLNAMLERIDAAMDRERAFVADASHELRTPLGILKAEIELALGGDRTHAELRRALISAGEETDHLVRLAEDLLVLSRAERGGIPIRTEPLLLATELGEAVAPFQRLADADGRAIDIEGAGDAQVVADPVRLRQAVGNLVDNALRHGQGAVTVRAVVEADAVEISVHDEGAGFSPDFAPRAFERFTRSDTGRSGRGAGLGLAIVAAIAEAHGGVARIAADKGSTIGFSIPQRRHEAATT
ncbi:MAG: ATP-binding protein [Thermoleophilia bacterium]|nr:ATP-binding protein [Thermoleophilia bacterium]MDH3725170.1 ATP-binding protein [Thermoleophilia bacterium]